jgi:hypothetical protein
VERVERVGRVERLKRVERGERGERGERVERVERVERAERATCSWAVRTCTKPRPVVGEARESGRAGDSKRQAAGGELGGAQEEAACARARDGLQKWCTRCEVHVRGLPVGADTYSCCCHPRDQ